MPNYPTKLTQKLLDTNAHITVEEIEKDIADTLAKIPMQEAKIAAQQTIINCPTLTQQSERKMALFRRDTAISGKTRRLAFIEFLKMLKKGKEEGLPND